MKSIEMDMDICINIDADAAAMHSFYDK